MPRPKHTKKLNDDQRLLVAQNTRLTRVIPLKYVQYTEKRELERVACVALCNAALCFNPAKGASFETFASRYINGELTRYIKRNVLHSYFNNGKLQFADMVSIDKPLKGNAEGLTLADTLADNLSSAEQELAQECLSCLSADEKEIIMYRFCFYGNDQNLEALRLLKYKSKSYSWLYRKSDALVLKMQRFALVNNILSDD